MVPGLGLRRLGLHTVMMAQEAVPLLSFELDQLGP